MAASEQAVANKLGLLIFSGSFLSETQSELQAREKALVPDFPRGVQFPGYLSIHGVHMNELMGRNEYARHRGCAPNAVAKAEDDGRIAAAVVRDEKGVFVGIKWRLADELWTQNTDPVEAARSKVAPAHRDALALTTPTPGSAAASVADASEPSPGMDAAGPASSDQADYLAARAKREGFQAKTAELEYLQAIAELVPAGEAREVAFRRYRTLRDKMLNIPERVASVIAAERDPARVHKLLTDEIKRVLNELSENARAEVAGGTQERVAA